MTRWGLIAGIAALTFVAGLAETVAALSNCKAKIKGGTGVIYIKAATVNGQLLWGNAPGEETNAFFNEATCGAALGGTVSDCTFGDDTPPADLAALTPPPGCRVYMADQGGAGDQCFAYIKKCTPGIRDTGGGSTSEVLSKMSLEDAGTTLRITGVNLQVVDGSGNTDGATNGLGNVIIGYNETVCAGDPSVVCADDLDCFLDGPCRTSPRTGSHNLLVGRGHTFSSFGGIGAGAASDISSQFASVTGGRRNTASAPYASVTGGEQNTASGSFASVTGGERNSATTGAGTVSGGFYNTASGSGLSTVSGGRDNVASGTVASVSGGSDNVASGDNASISGGRFNTASGSYSSVSGGGSYDSFGGNVASGAYSSVSGGKANTASGGAANWVGGGILNAATGDASAVSGGRQNTASAAASSVSGGRSNLASGFASSVSGGGGVGADSNHATAAYSSVSGGRDNEASGIASSVSGGFQNIASGLRSSVSGGINGTAPGTDDWLAGTYFSDY